MDDDDDKEDRGHEDADDEFIASDIQAPARYVGAHKTHTVACIDTNTKPSLILYMVCYTLGQSAMTQGVLVSQKLFTTNTNVYTCTHII